MYRIIIDAGGLFYPAVVLGTDHRPITVRLYDEALDLVEQFKEHTIKYFILDEKDAKRFENETFFSTELLSQEEKRALAREFCEKCAIKDKE